MDIEEALEKFRDPELGFIDLTGWHIRQVRDKKAKRALNKTLKRLLPRRKKGIEQSSYYRALRVGLLPDNPWIKREILELRDLFGIPEGQIDDLDLQEYPNRIPPWDSENIIPGCSSVA